MHLSDFGIYKTEGLKIRGMESSFQPTFLASEGTKQSETEPSFGTFTGPQSLAQKAAEATSLYRTRVVTSRIQTAQTLFSYISERLDSFTQGSEENVYHISLDKIPAFTQLAQVERDKIVNILQTWFVNEGFKTNWLRNVHTLDLTWEVPNLGPKIPEFALGSFRIPPTIVTEDATKKRKVVEENVSNTVFTWPV